MPSTQRRRSVLAACGAALLSGCSNRLLTAADDPGIECAPAEYAWPMHGYDAAQTSHLPARDLPDVDAGARRLSRTGASETGGGSVEAPPAVTDGVAYVAGDVRVEARDVETGERLWERSPDDSVSTSPAVACDAAYVGTANETLALARDGGAVLWRADAGTGSGTASASPVVVDDALYLATGGLAALDAETGDERWRVETGRVAQGVSVEERVYVGEGSDGSGAVAAYALDGTLDWRTELPGPVYAAPAVADGTVFAVSETGTLTALAAGDGGVEWRVDVGSGVYSSPAVADGRVFVEAGNGAHAAAFDAKTGEPLWRFETGVGGGAPTVVGDRALAAGANTGLHALDVETGERVRHWPVESVGSQPVAADGRLFYRAWNASDVFVVE